MDSKNKFDILLTGFFSLAFVIISNSNPVDENKTKSQYFEAQEIFNKKTQEKWGAEEDLLIISDYSQLKSFLGDRIIDFNGIDDIEKSQIENLKQIFFDFLISGNDGTFESYLKFRKYGNFSIITEKLDDDKYIQNDLEFYNIGWPDDPLDKLENLWKLNAIWQARQEHMNNYLLDLREKNKPTPQTDAEMIDLYSQIAPSFKEEYLSNPEKFKSARFLAINKDQFSITVSLVKNKETLPKVGRINMGLYPGIQGSTTRLFQYEESIDDILEKENLLFATISFIVKTNVSEGVIPMTIGFYWSPNDSRWLPDTVAKNTLGGYVGIL